MSTINHQIILRERPADLPGTEDFDKREVPVTEPQDGEVLLDMLYVSVDPAMRVWIGGNPGYVEPVAIGEVMRAGGIGRVVSSRDAVREPEFWQARGQSPRRIAEVMRSRDRFGIGLANVV